MIWRAERTIRPGTQNSRRRSGGGRRGAEVADARGDVQGDERAAEPEPVSVQLRGGQVAQRLAELCVFEALLDLRALAVEVLDLDRALLLGGDVSHDEAVGEGRVELAVEHHLQLLGRDRLAPARPRTAG